MQELSSDSENSQSAAEKQQLELIAIAAFCHAQKPRVQALHDNVARVYGKAGAGVSHVLRISLTSADF
jgi:hypothetical protein